MPNEKDNLSLERAKAFQEGWTAHKHFMEAIQAKAIAVALPPIKAPVTVPVVTPKPKRDPNAWSLTAKDHAILYEMGISCD